MSKKQEEFSKWWNSEPADEIETFEEVWDAAWEACLLAVKEQIKYLHSEPLSDSDCFAGLLMTSLDEHE